MVPTLKRFLCKGGIFACLVIFAEYGFAADLQRCVGKICIGESALTYQEIKARFHAVKFKSTRGTDFGRSLCVYERQAGVSMVLSFSGDANLGLKKLDGIFLTRKNLCETGAQKFNPSSLSTESGFRIGQSKQSVMERLGSPSRIDNAIKREQKDFRYTNTRYGSIYGVSRLHYEEGANSLLFNQFGIDENGAVVSIWLSDSP